MTVTSNEISKQLNEIASESNFALRASHLVAEWTAANVGRNAIVAILRFMEDRPDIDFGNPGPLVHFVERFYGHGYEDNLLESIERQPTLHTIWMLNRIINGAKSQDAKNRYISALRSAKLNPRTDTETAREIDEFFDRQQDTN